MVEWQKYDLLNMNAEEWINLVNDLTRHEENIESEPAVLEFFKAHIKRRREYINKFGFVDNEKQASIDRIIVRIASDNIAQSLKTLVKCYELLELIREDDISKIEQLSKDQDLKEWIDKTTSKLNELKIKEQKNESEDLHNTPTTNSMV